MCACVCMYATHVLTYINTRMRVGVYRGVFFS